MDKIKCIICEGDFSPKEPDQVKCKGCMRTYPNATSRADLLTEEDKEPLREFEKRVKLVVYEVLEEAGLVRKKCVSCENVYFARSPAQKVCKECSKKTEQVEAK